MALLLHLLSLMQAKSTIQCVRHYPRMPTGWGYIVYCLFVCV